MLKPTNEGTFYWGTTNVPGDTSKKAAAQQLWEAMDEFLPCNKKIVTLGDWKAFSSDLEKMFV